MAFPNCSHLHFCLFLLTSSFGQFLFDINNFSINKRSSSNHSVPPQPLVNTVELTTERLHLPSSSLEHKVENRFRGNSTIIVIHLQFIRFQLSGSHRPPGWKDLGRCHPCWPASHTDTRACVHEHSQRHTHTCTHWATVSHVSESPKIWHLMLGWSRSYQVEVGLAHSLAVWGM